MKALALTLMMLASSSAFAEMGEFHVSCGESRAKGPEAAEFGMESLYEGNHVYLNGTKVPDADASVVARGTGFIVNVQVPGGGSRRFEISAKPDQMQEYLDPIRGAGKKVGAPKPCKIKEDA